MGKEGKPHRASWMEGKRKASITKWAARGRSGNRVVGSPGGGIGVWEGVSPRAGSLLRLVGVAGAGGWLLATTEAPEKSPEKHS